MAAVHSRSAAFCAYFELLNFYGNDMSCYSGVKKLSLDSEMMVVKEVL
jgi:hypothetical protein